MNPIIEELRSTTSPVFDGAYLEEKFGGAFRWSYIRKLKSLGEIPAKCFVTSGRRLLVVRDPFLDWWASRLNVCEGGK
ncbi:MAG: hypothetical protein JEY79_19150 [Pseudodesulfovibrio sp.]|nr:hypothetical protein [Pseudodesulfovibrio sp.]